MDILINDILNSLLTLEAGASILMVGALAIVVRSFNLWSKKARELQPKLTSLNTELNWLREKIEPKKELISKLSKEIVPLREKEKEFDAFFQELKQAELDDEKVAEEQENSADKKRKLQRRRNRQFDGRDDS